MATVSGIGGFCVPNQFYNPDPASAGRSIEKDNTNSSRNVPSSRRQLAIPELRMRFQQGFLAGILLLVLLPNAVGQTAAPSSPGLTARAFLRAKKTVRCAQGSPYSKILQEEIERSLFGRAWPIDKAKEKLRRERCGHKTVRCAVRRAFSKTYQGETEPSLFASAWPTGKAKEERQFPDDCLRIIRS